MITIVGLSGSLRKQSYNSSLLRPATEFIPEGDRLTIETIRGIYDGDLEAEGIPEPVLRLKESIASADGLLLVTPEYNNSIPGVFKNAIDWLSRPPSDVPRIFRGKPVAIIGVSPGGFGTILSQNAWLPVLRTLRADHWSEGRLLVSKASDMFSEDGRLTDEKIKGQLREFVHGFFAYARERK